MTLTLAEAQVIVDAVFAHALSQSIAVSCCVINERNEEVLSARMDGANWPTLGIARAKARSAVALNQDSGNIAHMKSAFPELLDLVNDQLPFRVTTLAGGLLLKAPVGVRGAVGVSGALPDQDVACAAAGVAAWSIPAA